MDRLTSRLSPRLRRKMSIKKNRFKTPEQQAEDKVEAEKKKKPPIKRRKSKKAEAAKIKRVYKKKG